MLSGEAWDSHRIMLSWEDVLGLGARSPDDGFNVALHEFAHYLEAEGRGSRHRRTSRRRETPDARAAGARVRTIDDWADDSPTNSMRCRRRSIAARTRSWIPTRPRTRTSSLRWRPRTSTSARRDLRAAHPRLYALLQEFYGLDPAAWVMHAESGAPFRRARPRSAARRRRRTAPGWRGSTAREPPVTAAVSPTSMRPEHRRELAHHVVEAEEFRRLALGHQPPEIAAAQRLHAALHQPDDHGQRVEITRGPGC